ncbi:MAG TPA: LytR family transcriptional regulator, partial [Agromyces sp.]
MSGTTRRSEAGTAEVPRHGRMPRHGALATFLKVAVSVVAVLAVSAAGVAAWAAIDLVSSVKPTLELEGDRE